MDSSLLSFKVKYQHSSQYFTLEIAIDKTATYARLHFWESAWVSSFSTPASCKECCEREQLSVKLTNTAASYWHTVKARISVGAGGVKNCFGAFLSSTLTYLWGVRCFPYFALVAERFVLFFLFFFLKLSVRFYLRQENEKGLDELRFKVNVLSFWTTCNKKGWCRRAVGWMDDCVRTEACKSNS